MGDPASFLFLQDGCMDVQQPDIAVCAGLTAMAQVAALAEPHDRPPLPHVWGSTMNFHAAQYLRATLPGRRSGGPFPFPWMEYDVGPNPLLDLAGWPVLEADGALYMPDRPGLVSGSRPGGWNPCWFGSAS